LTLGGDSVRPGDQIRNLKDPADRGTKRLHAEGGVVRATLVQPRKHSSSRVFAAVLAQPRQCRVAPGPLSLGAYKYPLGGSLGGYPEF